MRNEIKILPYFLRHYETFADRIFVWEDQSDDGTREMLESHPKVTVLDPGHHGADDVHYVKNLWPQYKEISRGHADWVMCVDADEFVYHPNIIEVLEECDRINIKRIRCSGFLMYHAYFPTTNGQIYDEVKMGWVDDWCSKTIVFRPEVHMAWANGRHSPKCSKTYLSQTTGIKLLHFRCLGWDYTEERNKKNCKSMGMEYKNDRHHNLPKRDGFKKERGVIFDWIDGNKNNTINVLEV